MKATLYHVEGHQVRQIEGLPGIEAALEAGVGRFWLDFEGPDQATVAWLEERFHFHPLALEDLLLPNYRPKLAQYDDHLFLIGHAVHMPDGRITAQEIHAFLTRDFIITAHDAPAEPVARVQRALAGEAAILGRGPDHVLYLLVDEMAESYFHTADRVDDILDELEVAVLRRVDRRLLDRVFELRRGLSMVRRLSNHQRDALNALAAHEGIFVRRSNALYLRDVQNLMVTVHEIVDSQRDLTNGILEVYLSASSNRLNDIVKRLTLVATVFLPISFVAGVFGTNFLFMPFDNPQWFAAFVASLIAIPGAMLYWFWRSGWL